MIKKTYYLTSSVVSLLLLLSTAQLALSNVKQNKSRQVPVQNLKVNYPPLCYMRTLEGQVLDLTTLCGRVITTPLKNIRQGEGAFGQEIKVNEISGLAADCYAAAQTCFEPPENNK